MIFKLRYNDQVLLVTKSYRKLYKYLEQKFLGGLSFGIDLSTLKTLGYTIETIKNEEIIK